MKKFWIQIVAIFVVVVFVLGLEFNSSWSQTFFGLLGISNPIPAPGVQRNLTTTQAKIKDLTLNIEIAKTPEQRAKGLGGRDSLATNSGMLFVFDSPSKYRFWMKDMRFPLDFIWIRNNQVVDLLTNIPPPIANQTDATLPIYGPVSEVDEVLEVNSGVVAKNNIQIGDGVKILN